MAKTSNVFARVEPQVKEQAESILTELGIPMSNAVAIFLKQVIIHNGMPFDVKLQTKQQLSIENMTDEQLREEIQKGFDDIENERVYSLNEVITELKRDYKI